MTDPSPPAAAQAFDRAMAERYDARNAPLAPISGALHFLTRLALADLPARARVLCVGVGTGADILALAASRPDWRFVGVDPSSEMLRVCRDRLAEAGVLARCDLIEGEVAAVPLDTGFEGADPGPAGFDAALSLLVAHFIGRAERPGFYRAVRDRLRPGGRFVTAEICADPEGPAFPSMLRDWAQVQSLMGASPESLAALPETLRERLSVLSPAETDALLVEAGFGPPVPFFRACMIRGAHAERA